jgi:MYM-type Zinc finger with FCS sequence motif.
VAYVIKTCEGCGQEFELKPDSYGRVYSKKRFCTRKCWLTLYNREDRYHTMKGAYVAGAVNAEKLRGTSRGGNAYVKENQRHQHRVVAEQLLQRALTLDEVVHHEDRNRKNNDPSNLIVFKNQSDHVYHHNWCMKRPIPCECMCIRLKDLLGGDAL